MVITAFPQSILSWKLLDKLRRSLQFWNLLCFLQSLSCQLAPRGSPIIAFFPGKPHSLHQAFCFVFLSKAFAPRRNPKNRAIAYANVLTWHRNRWPLFIFSHSGVIFLLYVRLQSKCFCASISPRRLCTFRCHIVIASQNILWWTGEQTFSWSVHNKRRLENPREGSKIQRSQEATQQVLLELQVILIR